MKEIFILKKYQSPRFEYIQISVNTSICTSSAETPIVDVIEFDDDDDP